MFNKLLEKGELKYVFTDKRKDYYIQSAGNLGNIFLYECGKICLLFIKANIQNESDYIKFLLQFNENNFQKNYI